MRELRAQVTKKSLLAGTTILVIATMLLLLAGVDPAPYLSGVAAGIIGVGVVMVLVERRRRKTHGERLGDRPS